MEKSKNVELLLYQGKGRLSALDASVPLRLLLIFPSCTRSVVNQKRSSRHDIKSKRSMANRYSTGEHHAKFME
jgi:hypothetical protein